jgi:hypothetical protein
VPDGVRLSARDAAELLPWGEMRTRFRTPFAGRWAISSWVRYRVATVGAAVRVADEGAPVVAAGAFRAVGARLSEEGTLVPLCGVSHPSVRVSNDRATLRILCALFAARPALRPALADDDAVRALIEAMLAGGFQPGPGRDDGGRRTAEVRAALRQLGYVHPLGGRPLPSDRLPARDVVVHRVVDRLRSSPMARSRAADADEVARIVDQAYLSVPPWPVPALAPEA